MKKFFSIFAFIAVAAIALTSCSKESDTNPINENGVKMKTITVRTGIGTKTTLDSDHSKLQWSTGDKISLFNNVDNDNAELAYTAGGDITVKVPATTTEIYAHYPYYEGNEDGPTNVSVYISNNQTQNNPGELNGYYFPMVAKGTVSSDNKALISFYPVASAFALNIYKTTLGDAETEMVTSVKVTPAAENTGFIKQQYMDLTGSNLKYNSTTSSDAITVTLTNPLTLSKTKPTDAQKFDGQIYVCLAKQSYANVKFEIKTDKGTYTITSNSTAFDLETKDFVPVNINLSKATFEEKEAPVDPTAFNWVLVKDKLAVGDKVVIAASGYPFAMSTTQNSNNRSQIEIAKSGNSLTANADVQVFEVVSGSKSNTFALKCLNGNEIGKFITSASSSKNYLHSIDEINDNASWSISINTESGVAGIVAQGTYTRNTIKYNSNDGIFACYASGQSDVAFYRSALPSANLSFPEESYTVNIGETFMAPTLTNPYSVTVTYSSSNPAIASVDPSTGAITIGSTAGKATITASFAGNSSYSATEASYEINVIDPNVEHWVKTSIGSITASDVFVIVGDDGYALPHNNGSSSAPGLVSVTISNDMITSEVSDDIKWNLSVNADGFVFYPNGNNTTWLYCTNSNNGVRIGTNDNKFFTINNNGYLLNTATSRYLSVYNTQDWRCYSNTDNNPQVIEFYVKQGGSSTPTKTLSSISVTPPTKTTYTVGDSFDATGMVVTATYSDATTADVTASATTDFASQVASAGNKTVTVTYTEGGITKIDTFDITVNAATGTTVTFTPGTDTDDTTVTKDGITVIMTTMNNDSYYQVYANQSMTVSSSSHKIIGISFTCTASGTSKYGPGNASANVGTYSYSGSTGSWSGNASSVTISSTAQIRMTSLTITYE